LSFWDFGGCRGEETDLTRVDAIKMSRREAIA